VQLRATASAAVFCEIADTHFLKEVLSRGLSHFSLRCSFENEVRGDDILDCNAN
jgi:hypothetical protein